MATRREDVADSLRWGLQMLRIFARRALIFGCLAAVFAAAVLYTTRERVSDCAAVTDEQRVAMASLRDASPSRSFDAGPARCANGVYAAPLLGIAGTMEEATEQLAADGWRWETEFIAHFDRLWRRCFSFDEAGWERVQITVDANRAGVVRLVQISAPERGDACDLEQRDVSPFYPPAS